MFECIKLKYDKARQALLEIINVQQTDIIGRGIYYTKYYGSWGRSEKKLIKKYNIYS